MDEIASYLSLAICLAVCVGLISSLVTDEFRERAEGTVGLVCIFALAAPIISTIGALPEITLPDFDTPAYEMSGGYVEVSAEAFGEGVSLAVAERIGVDEECVSAQVGELVPEQMRVGELTVTLSGAAALADSRGLLNWLRESFVTEGGVCKVVIDIE